MATLPLPFRKIHPAIGDDALYGGIDLAGTLSKGEIVVSTGVLQRPAALVLTMADRCQAGLAAKLAHAVDRPGFCLIALDEGDDGLPPSLLDRVGLFVDLDGIGWGEVQGGPDSERVVAARARLSRVEMPGTALAELTTLAARLGISSLRAPMLCAAAARAEAALCGREKVELADLEAAVALVYAHRAVVFPEIEPDEEAATPPPSTPGERDESDRKSPRDDLAIPEDILLDAVRASLPPDILAQLAAGRAQRGAKSSAGSGARRRGNRRGRPLPSLPGKLDGTARIDLVATLRAAAPWQTLRKTASPRGQAVSVRASDIRVKRFEDKSDRLLVFTVDASGSAALARLAEAKGAVELLLAEAYARRDHVALIAFRGDRADLLLPPTRSLVQTKRRLASLPGGGGTPMAAGLRAALEQVELAQTRGMTPSIVLLTDGRANIALDGTADRAVAKADAERMARLIRAHGTPTLVVDSAARPQAPLRDLAALMGAPYLPLPRAESNRLSQSVSAALES